MQVNSKWGKVCLYLWGIPTARRQPEITA